MLMINNEIDDHHRGNHDKPERQLEIIKDAPALVAGKRGHSHCQDRENQPHQEAIKENNTEVVDQATLQIVDNAIANRCLDRQKSVHCNFPQRH